MMKKKENRTTTNSSTTCTNQFETQSTPKYFDRSECENLLTLSKCPLAFRFFDLYVCQAWIYTHVSETFHFIDSSNSEHFICVCVQDFFHWVILELVLTVDRVSVEKWSPYSFHCPMAISKQLRQFSHIFGYC